jgi:hypothetical protein
MYALLTTLHVTTRPTQTMACYYKLSLDGINPLTRKIPIVSLTERNKLDGCILSRGFVIHIARNLYHVIIEQINPMSYRAINYMKF